MSNGFQIVTADFGSMLKIKKTGQGPVPKELKGYFTSHSLAQLAIERHLKTRKVKNVKTGSSSTD